MQSIALQIYTHRGVSKEHLFPDKKVLHLGCGNSKLAGAVGIDMLTFPSVDVVHNLDLTPWPLEANSVDVFFAHSVIGHLSSLVDFFNEVSRVGKNGSRIIISTPYFRSIDAFSDPTMKHFFTSSSMDYFLDTDSHFSGYQYTKHKFKKIGFWYGWPQLSQNPLTRLFKAFIHQYSKFYDQYLSLLIPVKILVWELEIKK
ncbi:MAG: methyltransferase domain-containing protein [Parcubacteria group bacterium]|nr:methyltransferase domain-containing protein [Parcubacteria group bacterium]